MFQIRNVNEFDFLEIVLSDLNDISEEISCINAEDFEKGSQGHMLSLIDKLYVLIQYRQEKVLQKKQVGD
jgi:hypothetical protein